MTTSGDKRPLAQGDLRLLESDLAQRLLASTMPVRVAFCSPDGSPRIVSTWFQWIGEDIVMPTFISAPNVRHPVARIRALRPHPAVAISIDTNSFPPEALVIRGSESKKTTV